MKLSNLTTLFALALSFILFSFTTVEKSNLTVDIEKSTVIWKGHKVTGSHEGTLALKEGSVEYTDGALTGGSFVIDMTSLTSTDLTGEYKGKLEGHLKSADFFDTEVFTTTTFVITKVASKGTPGDYKVIGDLTIKETTQQIKFYAHVDETDAGHIFTADITFDRTDFNVQYGSGSFFDSLGDKTIYDDIDLNVTLVAKK